MRKLLALLAVYILLTCEWQNTVSLLFQGSSCCMIVCCMNDEGCKEDNMNSACPVTCYSCWYEKPEIFEFYLSSPSLTNFTEYKNSKVTFYIADVFHPPELV